MSTAVAIRAARIDDWPMLAAIHAASWRSAYRGLLPDEFLDREVDGERAAHWRSRMHAADATELGIFLAEAEGRALGFALVDLDASPARGALLDNLHVAPGFTGRGIGRVLLGRAARWASDRRADIALHLELLDGNDAAARFYLRHGARPGARILKRRPEGPVAFILYSWPDAAALAAALRQ